MKRLLAFSTLALTAIVLVAGCGDQAAAPPPAAGTNPTGNVPGAGASTDTGTSTDSGASTASADGASVYTQNCQGCHGDAGQGGTGPAIVGEVKEHSADELKETVLNGHGKMPAFKDKLSTEQVDAVVAHIKTFGG